jgi:anti-sigma28 factor (negative regulator of flagellin synthesis)
MNPINNVGGNSPIHKITSTPVQKEVPAAQTSRPSQSDRVELSGAAPTAGAAKAGEIRADKVASIKAQIAAGTYDDMDHKLDASLDKLLDDLLK